MALTSLRDFNGPPEPSGYITRTAIQSMEFMVDLRSERDAGGVGRELNASMYNHGMVGVRKKFSICLLEYVLTRYYMGPLQVTTPRAGLDEGVAWMRVCCRQLFVLLSSDLPPIQ